MATETINLADLRPIQTRAETDAATIEEYAEAAQRGAKFPPVSVIADAEANTFWLWDGVHRMEATRRLGKKCIRANVQGGTYADALRLALGANATHGLRRTNADKRKALDMAWKNRRTVWPREDNADPSAEILADVCGVSLRTAKAYVAMLQPVQKIEVERPSTSANERGSADVQPVQIAPVERRNPPPVRRVFGKDGKTRTIAPIRPIATAKTAPQAPSRAPAYDHAAGVATDRFGVEIPMQIRGAFKAETVRDEIETHLRTAANLLKRAMDEKDPSVAQFRQADLIDLQNAVRTAKFTKPYCVCRICQGNGRGSCSACHETGFQTQAQYENNPKEFKA